MIKIVSMKMLLSSYEIPNQMREETYTAFENIYPVLREFRKVQQ